MYDAISHVLIDEARLQQRIRTLGEQLSHDYRDSQELLLVGVLKGSVVFLSDLMRTISVPVAIDFIAAASYGASTHTSGVVRILKDLERDIGGKDVLVVEDIIDSGRTLSYLQE